MQYNGKLTILSPLAHNSDESCGVDTKFRRINSIWNGESIRIPVYSGNAFRGILRRLAAKQFCDMIGLQEKSISDKLYYIMFSGGMLEKGVAQDFIDVGEKRKIRELIPFLSVFGSAIGNMILPGKIQVGMCIPITKETQHMTGYESVISVWEIMDEIFYTRRDDKEDKEKTDQAQQMKYTVEVISPGVELKQNISILSENPIEIGCLDMALQELIKNGVLGGKSGTGHGNVSFSYIPGLSEKDIEKYKSYIQEKKEDTLEYIKKLEAPCAKKKEKKTTVGEDKDELSE